MNVCRTPIWLRGLAVAGGTLLVLSGCRGDSTAEFNGMQIENAAEVLEEAQQVFDGEVADDVKAGTTTVSEDSRCYFLRDGEDSVAEELYCGPTRVLGEQEAAAWLPVPVNAGAGAEETALLTIEDEEADSPTAVDVGKLFRPDGEEPVEVDSLAAPEAPESPESNFAVLIETGNLDISADFTEPDQPYRIVTPSASITVAETAKLNAIPQRTVGQASSSGEDGDGAAEQDESDTSAPSFRPADGQQAHVWKVTIGAPPEVAPEPEDGFLRGDGEPRDASTSLAVQAGSQRLNVVGEVADGADPGVIPCEKIQCDNRDEKQYFLVVSSPDETTPALVATVDGTDQSLDLTSGKLDSEVSQVGYERSTSVQQTAATWSEKTHLVRTEDQLKDDGVEIANEDAVFQYGGEVRQVYLSPFDYTKGWAPSGKAWLVVPIENDPKRFTDGVHEAELDLAKSWTLTEGSEKHSHDDGAGSPNTAAFLVDDTFSSGTFAYRPTGSANSLASSYSFSVDEPLTVDIEFPR